MKPFALVCVIVAGCGSAPAPAPAPFGPVGSRTPTSQTPISPAPPPSQAVALPPGVPDTLAGHQLAWLLDVATSKHWVLERAEVEHRFAPAFLKQIPADQLVTTFAGLAKQLGTIELTKIDAVAPTKLVAHGKCDGGPLVIQIALNANDQIEELLFQPDTPPAPPMTFASYDEAGKALAALAPHASMMVAALDHGACKPLHAIEGKAELAIGSTFKLYVLLGLADRIIAGKQTWDDEIAVADDWKSLPSGVTQNDAAGTKLSVRTLAERMISISDNTATDHLLYTIGRKTAETALHEAKHAKPGLDTPFFATREMFLLKLETPAAEQDGYLARTEAKRREYLDKTLAGKHPSTDGIAAWKTARRIDRIEWFASPEDLCRVMGTLWTRAQDPKAAAVLDVLAKNAGIPFDKTTWPYVGFKGGSEPGVLDLTWLLRRDDGKWFIASVTWNTNEGGEVDEQKAVAFASGLIALAAKSDR